MLTPDTVVERKALDDLTQSLQSGRVFKQTEQVYGRITVSKIYENIQMLRHYDKVVLLIESGVKFDSRIVNGGPFQVRDRMNTVIRAMFSSLRYACSLDSQRNERVGETERVRSLLCTHYYVSVSQPTVLQGELSRHCREIRMQLCMLVRKFPRMRIIWSSDPDNSAEFFTELKVCNQSGRLIFDLCFR